MTLEMFDNKTTQERKLVVKPIERIEDLKFCHVLYIGQSKNNQYESILTNLTGKNVLTVSDITNFASRGGIIELYRTNDKINFAINIKVMNQSNLKISSQVLELGKIVK